MMSFLRSAGLIVLFFILLFIYGKYGPGLPISQISTVTQRQQLFTVSGTGKVTVVPDLAHVNFGIQISRPDVKTVQSEANTAINQVSSTLKSLGIDAKDIKTSSYYISPKYNYNNGSSQINGYTASITLTITVRKLDTLNAAIDQATTAGANNVSGIQLTVDEDRQKELVKQARKEAIAEAKSKAQELASESGLSLGRLIDVQENGGYSPRPIYDTAMLKTADGQGGGTQIEAGSTDISSSVTLTYETR